MPNGKESTQVLLARIDERVHHIANEIKEIKAMRAVCDSKFVEKTEFAPVKTIAFGAARIILVVFIGAVAALVM